MHKEKLSELATQRMTELAKLTKLAKQVDLANVDRNLERGGLGSMRALTTTQTSFVIKIS
jgi:hypothetical protein